MLFRTHVSRKAAGMERAVLEGVGLDAPTIDLCFRDNPLSVEEAVQDGLTRWAGGQGTQPPTWKVLTDAMDYAGIAQHYVQGLKNKLGMYVVRIRAYMCSVHVCVLAFWHDLSTCPDHWIMANTHCIILSHSKKLLL